MKDYAADSESNDGKLIGGLLCQLIANSSGTM